MDAAVNSEGNIIARDTVPAATASDRSDKQPVDGWLID
jgi:hypothetical protein